MKRIKNIVEYLEENSKVVAVDKHTYTLANGDVVEHQDRLTRFQFNFIRRMFESYGCEVTVLNGADVSSEEELAADMMSLLASFSGKFYGRRSAQRRKKIKKQER